MLSDPLIHLGHLKSLSEPEILDLCVSFAQSFQSGYCFMHRQDNFSSCP